MNSTPIEQKTIVGKCFIIYANRMIYLSCFCLVTDIIIFVISLSYWKLEIKNFQINSLKKVLVICYDARFVFLKITEFLSYYFASILARAVFDIIDFLFIILYFIFYTCSDIICISEIIFILLCYILLLALRKKKSVLHPWRVENRSGHSYGIKWKKWHENVAL